MSAQDCLPPELFNEGGGSKKHVYLVTCAHPTQDRAADGTPLRSPNTYSHKMLLDAILDAFAEPIYDAANAGRGLGGVPLFRCLVAAEYHKAGADGQINRHYHIAIQAFSSFRFVAIKRALLSRHGIATHWSNTHVGYWSALSYLVKGSEKKPMACLDPNPLPWHFNGVADNLRELATHPTTAVALEARRDNVIHRAEVKGQPEPRPSEIDIWPIIVKYNIHKDDDSQAGVYKLIHIAKDSCTPAMVRYLFKMRHKLPGIIDDVWHWQCVDERLHLGQRSCADSLLEALNASCVCGGRWPACVGQSLAVNGISWAELCHDIFMSLMQGRSETTPVICLAGLHGGEGKSLIFYPLPALLGSELVYQHTATGTFALLGLQGKKAVVLDEWTFDASSVPLSTQLLWFEGKPVPITRPQNDFAGHTVYKGTAPIFITTPLKRMEKFITEAERACYWGESSIATMVLRRLKLYKFTQRLPMSGGQIAQCAHCVARFVLEGEAAFQTR